jgi:hypothetical protein
MPLEWKPKGVTSRAAVESGLLSWGAVFEASSRFRSRQMDSGEVSADWDAAWLVSLQSAKRKED